MKIPAPKEAEEQKAVFAWAEYQKTTMPELEMLYHTPNGGSRNKPEAAHLKKQGVKSGVPDLCLPVPKAGYHGLYIELKRIGGEKPTPAQEKWLKRLRNQGYFAAVCCGADIAIRIITAYLNGEV